MSNPNSYINIDEAGKSSVILNGMPVSAPADVQTALQIAKDAGIQTKLAWHYTGKFVPVSDYLPTANNED